MSGFKIHNPGISRVLSVKKLGFLTFSQKRYYEFFLIFCMIIETKTVRYLDQESGFKKDNAGISRGFDNSNLRVFLMIDASIVQRLAAVLLSGSTSSYLFLKEIPDFLIVSLFFSIVIKQ